MQSKKPTPQPISGSSGRGQRPSIQRSKSIAGVGEYPLGGYPEDLLRKVYIPPDMYDAMDEALDAELEQTRREATPQIDAHVASLTPEEETTELPEDGTEEWNQPEYYRKYGLPVPPGVGEDDTQKQRKAGTAKKAASARRRR